MGVTAAWKSEDLRAALAILAGVSLFHARGIAPGQTFLPVDLAENSLPWLSGSPAPLQNWLISDPLFQSYPFLVHAVGAVRQGGWPLWNPDILTGHPVFADPVAQPFYPVFLALATLFGPARGLALGLWLHALLAAFLTFGLIRAIGCRAPAATIGAITYALSGYMVTWFETTFWVGTLAWLPGVLWAFELAMQRRSLGYALLAALAMGLALLGGQLVFGAAFLLFLGLYALMRTPGAASPGSRWRLWPLAVLAIVAVLGTMLAAMQIVPLAEFLALSHRASPGGPSDPLPWRQLITLLVPGFYGNPATTGSYRGALNFSEGTIYAGLPALVLAAVAVLSVRRPFVLCLAAIAALEVFVAVGGPGSGLLGAIPGLQYTALHRLVFLLPLLLAVLAALAADEPKPQGRAVLASGSLAAAAILVAVYTDPAQAREHLPELEGVLLRAAGLLALICTLLLAKAWAPSGRRLVDGCLVLLVFGDLFSFGYRFNPTGPIAALAPPTSMVELLRAEVGPQRVVVCQTDDRLLFGPNLLSIYGIADAGGYSSVVSGPLQRLVSVADPKREATGVGRYLRSNGNIVFFDRPSPRLLDLLGVGYVISPSPLADAEEPLVEVYRGEAYVYRGEAYVYRRSPPPRARVVYAAERIDEESGAIRRLLDAAFDLRNTAITADPLDLPSRVDIPSTPAEVVGYGDTRVTIVAGAAQPGLLVMADQYYPGWRVCLDGQPATLYRVNLVQRGVLLPPGEHEVVLELAPDSLRLGGALSLVGLLAVVGPAGFAALRRLRQNA